MKKIFFLYPLLLAGLGSLLVEPESGVALFVSSEPEISSQGPSDGPGHSDLHAVAGVPLTETIASNSSIQLKLGTDAADASSGKWRSDAESFTIRGRLHVDLSLRSNVELLAQLAPLVLRLTAEQRALTSSSFAPPASVPETLTVDRTSFSFPHTANALEKTSENSADPTVTAKSTLRPSLFPEIQLELSYHIFDMDEDISSAPHCITDELGRFCAFPPNVTPSPAESSSQHLGGRAIVEETLLQLCVAKFAEKSSWTGEMTPANDSGGKVTDDTAEQASRKDAMADRSAEGKVTDVGATTAPPSQARDTDVPGHSDSNGPRLQLLWEYVNAWCCNCNTLDRDCDPTLGALGTGIGRKTGVLQEGGAGQTGKQKSFSPFDAECSRAQLAKLRIQADALMKKCEKAAEGTLQHQVDNRLSVVPSLLIDGKPALGELTAASVMKALCLVAEERAAAASASPRTPAPELPTVCRTPLIMSNPGLVVKSFGVGVNSEFVGSLESGASGQLGVAAHLLSTYGRTPEAPASQSAAPTRPGVDAEGRYHFVNPKALRFLRKRMLARRSRRVRKIVPVVSADADSAAASHESGGAAAPPLPSEILMKSSAAVQPEAGAIAAAGEDALTERAFSTSPVYSSTAIESVDEATKEAITTAATPPMLDAPSSVPVVLQSGKTFHLECGKHVKLPVSDPLRPKQQRTEGGVAEESARAAEQLKGIAKPAGVPSCEDKSKLRGCVSPSSDATTDRGDLVSPNWSLYLFIGFAVSVAAIAWFFVCRKRAAVLLPAPQQVVPVEHQTSLLGDKPPQTVPSRNSGTCSG